MTEQERLLIIGFLFGIPFWGIVIVLVMGANRFLGGG